MQTKQTVKPRDYQETALENLKESRENGKDTGLLVMATGTGKTLTAAFDVQQVEPEKVLFLAHQQEIIKQAKDEFDKTHPKKSKGLYYGKHKEKDEDFVFATRQTLSQKRHLNKFDKDEFDYIIVDEFHHAMSETYRQILDYFEPEFMLGLTATPFLIDVDEEDILDYLELEEPSFRYETDEATQRGDLSKFEAKVYKDNIDYSKAPGDLTESDLNKKLFLPERNKYIAEKWLEEAEDRKTIAFCRNIEHAERTSIHFSQKGVNAETVHSEMPDTKRNKRIRKFRKGEIDVLATVDIFNEGVDFPEVAALIFMRPTMSERIFHQQLGRGLRNVHGKDKCLVLDFVNETDWNRLDWYGVSPSKTEYKSGKCEECGRESSELLENEEQELVCKQCRTEDVEIATGMGEIKVDLDALFDIADEYQQYRFTKCNKENILEDLKRVKTEINGEILKKKEYQEKGNYDATTVRKYFSSWPKALEKVGLKPYHIKKKLSKDEILEELNKVAENYEEPISSEEIRNSNSLPAPKTITDKFDGLNNALIEAGLVPSSFTGVKDEVILDRLKKFSEENDMNLTNRNISNSDFLPSAELIRNRFGSLEKAKDMADIEEQHICEICGREFDSSQAVKNHESQSHKYSKDQLTEILINLAEEKGRIPKVKDFKGRDDLPSRNEYYNTFGSFNEALESAGFNLNKKKWAKAKIVQSVKDYLSNKDKDNIKIKDFRESSSLPSQATIHKVVGGINPIKEELDLNTDRGGTTSLDVLEDLVFSIRNYDVNLQKDYLEKGDFSGTTIRKYLNSWSEAKHLAKRCINEDLRPEEVLRDEGYEVE
jgi:superfamily II DNA or RNA helicase